MWRSVFLHEFPDDEIRNFEALAGSPTPASLTLTPTWTAPLRTNTVRITPGRGFEYSLAESLDQVIGVSGRVRLLYPIQNVTDAVSIMRLGDMVAFSVQRFGDPFLNPDVEDPLSNPAELVIRARGLLRIGPLGTTPIQIGVLLLPHRRFVDVRFDWHTSGQARLLQDGKLIGYQNAVAPTAQVEVANVVFGLPDVSSVATNPRYQVGRVFVRTLRRSDSLAAFSRLLPDIDVPDDEAFERCRLRAIIDMLGMVDRLRQFMALVHQNLSQPWTRVSGPPEGPFKPEATAAHELATKSIVELGRMMRTGDFSTAEGFLEPFEKFLRILHDALPNEFVVLADELTKTAELPAECRPVLEAVLDQHRAGFGPLLDVLSVASDRVRDIAGGN